MIPNLVCALVWRSTEARLCIWNQRDEGRGRQDPQIEKRAIAQVPLFISNSNHGAQFLAHSLGVNYDLISVIRNGVEITVPDMERETIRQQLDIPDHSLVGCMIANLHGDKDHVTLLKSWRLVVDKLRAEDSAPLLLLAGRSDDMRSPLQRLVQRLELDPWIRFLGPVKNIPNLLSAIDIGVFSSRLEGCPNGILESMAAEKAIAATDIPGVREAVGVNGYAYLAPPGDAESLANAIIELFTRPSLRAQLGHLNRRRIESRFTVSRMCQQTTSLIMDHLPA
jgi:glycosyltransferase involved in cell wall biosynthesis